MRIITYIILAIIVLIYLTPANFYNTGYDVLDYPIRSFYHADMSHLLANAVSFISLSFIEDVIGTKQFIIAILFIWIVSSMILYFIHLLIPSRKIYTVGFSAIIFGLIVIYYSLLNQSAGITLIGLTISIIPQLIVPGISFEGHLSGIMAGIIYVMLFPVNKLSNN